MQDEQLHILLHRADAAAPAVDMKPDLSRRVRALAAARNRLRRRLCGAIGLFLVGAAVAGALNWRGRGKPSAQALDPQPLPTPSIEAVRAEMASADAEIAARLALVEALLDAGERRQVEARIRSAPDAMAEIRRQQDQAAIIVMGMAEHRRGRGEPVHVVGSEYRKVIQLFPGSSWAELARERLKEIEG